VTIIDIEPDAIVRPAATIVAHVPIAEADAEPVAQALTDELGGIETAVATFETPDGSWALELYFFNRMPDEARIRGLVARIAGSRAACALTFGLLADNDWVTASLAGLSPVRAGRFVIHGRHDRASVGVNRVAIEIEAALAFGTGHHGTTRGCLLALDQILKAHRPRSVLDIGTGTGVLAIAAAKVLRRPVAASDLDREAVGIARANAALNGARPLVEVVHAAGSRSPRLRARNGFDLVLANILLGPLKRLAASVVAQLSARGRVILSGLLPAQANAALAAYRRGGLVLERRIALEGWTTLVLARRRTTPAGVVATPQRRIVAPAIHQ